MKEYENLTPKQQELFGELLGAIEKGAIEKNRPLSKLAKSKN